MSACDWTSQGWLKTHDINHMTSLHLWAAVAANLVDATLPQDPYHHNTPSILLEDKPIWMVESGNGPDWEWMPPDLSPGGEWPMGCCRGWTRTIQKPTNLVANLKAAIHGSPMSYNSGPRDWRPLVRLTEITMKERAQSTSYSYSGGTPPPSTRRSSGTDAP
jgi:hypothetical protein